MEKRKLSILRKMIVMLLSLFLLTGLAPNAVQTAKAADAKSLSNPRIQVDASMEAGQKTTYDCIYFGSYPQTEIVKTASECGTYGKAFYKTSDYVADESLYNKLANATGWDANGDITIDGTKYRRIQQSDASYVFPNSDVGLYEEFYWWYNSDAAYRYFRYEPIKWRVLKVSGDQAFLLADVALDSQSYYPSFTSVTWENSTIRSWLNGYKASDNLNGTDYSEKNFIDTAFSSVEQKAIVDSNVNNTTSSYYCSDNPCNDTVDKIYLLATYDIKDTDDCITYGFIKSYMASDLKYDEARMCKTSTYAKAMGTEVEYSDTDTHLGNCCWWLRSSGYYNNRVDTVNYSGSHNSFTYSVNVAHTGVRPVLNINLSSSSWTAAGTVCTDGTVVEDTSTVAHTHDWSVTAVTVANCVSTGLNKYTCSGCDAFMYEKTAIDPDNHPDSEQIIEDGKDPTCTESGYTEQVTCNLCKNVVKPHETIKALGHDMVIDIPAVPKTCRTSGYTEQSHCSRCSYLLERTEIPCTGHQRVTIPGTPATVKADGKTERVCCANCDKVYSESETVPRINKITISYTTAVYNGKVKSPTVKIYDRTGEALEKDTDYKLSVPSGRKNVGVYTYTITFKGNYSGTKKLTLTINPKGTTLSKLTALKKSFKVTWKKNSTQTSGYQIQYSTSGSFASGKTKTVTVGTSTTTKTIKSLKAKTKYYVRIRTYKKVSGKNYYSAWSAKKYVKTK